MTDLVVPVPVQPIFFKADPVDAGRKLNVHKTFRIRPGRLLNVLCKFILRPVSMGDTLLKVTGTTNSATVLSFHLIWWSQNIYFFGINQLVTLSLSFDNRNVESIMFNKTFFTEWRYSQIIEVCSVICDGVSSISLQELRAPAIGGGGLTISINFRKIAWKWAKKWPIFCRWQQNNPWLHTFFRFLKLEH